MKQTLTFHSFLDAFRSIRPDNFSRAGLAVLFDHLEEYEEASGTELELDVIALCCDYSEEDPQDIAANYGIYPSEVDPDDPDGLLTAVIDYLDDKGTLVGYVKEEGTIVYSVF